MAASGIANDERLRAVAARQPYPLLFVTVSRAHLYGFPSPDSDYDLRGVHVLAVREVVGLRSLTPDALASTLVRMVRKRTLRCNNQITGAPVR